MKKERDFFWKKFLCQILIHLFLSDAKSAVRPAIVLFENYSYLLGGQWQKCLWTKTFHTSAHRRFRQVWSDRISSKYMFLSKSTDVFVIVHPCIKKRGERLLSSICSGIRFCPRASTFFVGQHTKKERSNLSYKFCRGLVVIFSAKRRQFSWSFHSSFFLFLSYFLFLLEGRPGTGRNSKRKKFFLNLF